MDPRSELARERRLLVRADRDLAEGHLRVRAQHRLVSDLRFRGADVRQAECLLRLLRETLRHWRRHRVLILQRIAHLEAEASTLTPSRTAPSRVEPDGEASGRAASRGPSHASRGTSVALPEDT